MVRCIRRVWLACWCFWRRMLSFAQTFVKKLLQSTCSQRTRAWSVAEPPNDESFCWAWLGWGSSTTERLSELPRGTWTVKAWTYWQAPRGNFKLACLVWLLHLSKMLESYWLQHTGALQREKPPWVAPKAVMLTVWLHANTQQPSTFFGHNVAFFLQRSCRNSQMLDEVCLEFMSQGWAACGRDGFFGSGFLDSRGFSRGANTQRKKNQINRDLPGFDKFRSLHREKRGPVAPCEYYA